MKRRLLGLLMFVLSCSWAQAREDLSVTLDSVEVTGVTRVQSTEIESVIEVAPGDHLDRGKVFRSEENLKTLYRSHGYEEAKLQTELKRVPRRDGGADLVLEFKIEEGNPTRIGAVKISLDSAATDETSQLFWRRTEKRLGTLLNLSPGAVFDREKVNIGRRSIHDLLAAEEFIGATVSEPILAATTPPPGHGEPTARWVELEFKISLGDRVSFGFQGNSVISRERLLQLVDEQRMVGLGTDYVSAIKNRIADEYRSKGYTWVKVVPYTFEKAGRQERRVSFHIEEGNQVQLGELKFDGNRDYSSELLLKKFYEQAPLLTQRRIFVQSEIEKSSELLIQWMKSQGYLSSKLVTIARSFDLRNNRMSLTVFLYEGVQTYVRDVKVIGNTLFSSEEIKATLSVKEDTPLNLFALNDGIDRLKKKYRDHGYLAMSLSNEGLDSLVRYQDDNQSALLQIDLAEGPRYSLSRIDIEIQGKTVPNVVQRDLSLKEGEVLEEYRITEAEARLRKIGVFSGVTLRTQDDPNRPDGKILKVVAQDGTPGVIEGGVGLRNDLGMRGFGRISYNNLWRRAHTTSFSLMMNRRIEAFTERRLPYEYKAQLAYLWPWFMNDSTNFRPSIQMDRTQYINFNAFSRSITLSWDRLLIPRPSLTGVLSYTLERTDQFGASSAVDNQTLTIGSVTPSLRLDLRDDPLAPTRGFYSNASFEIADPNFLSQREPYPVGFTRFQWRNDYIVPFTPESGLFLSFRTGLERNTQQPRNPNDPNDPSGSIPLIKQFALGGASSLRGFKEQELNLQDKIIRGTATYVNYRAQLDLPFAGPLRFGPFLDAANLLIDQYSLGRLRYGTGAGFRYQTPVGPVNFDWGFKVKPRPGEEPYRFYFSIGVI